MRTIKELAKEAIDVQNACNLSGLVHGWSRSITELRELCPGAGTDTINRHPINVMWASKVSALTGVECLCDNCMRAFGEAYTSCKALAEIS